MSGETRGYAIKRRRLKHGIKSVRAFAEASGVSRVAVTAAEEGTASEGTYERLEAWLDRFERAAGGADGGEDVADKRGDFDALLRALHSALGNYLGVPVHAAEEVPPAPAELRHGEDYVEPEESDGTVYAYQVRKWAQATGRKVSTSGRVSGALFDAYIDYLKERDKK